MKNILMKLKRLFCLCAVSGSFFSCNLKYNDNPHNIKYKVTLNSGLQQTHYFVLSEIQYLPNRCIKFEQFAYGKIDTAVVCGNFSVENYR